MFNRVNVHSRPALTRLHPARVLDAPRTAAQRGGMPSEACGYARALLLDRARATSLLGLSLPELEDQQGPDLPRVILTPLNMTLE